MPDATGECPADAPGCTWNHTVPDSWQLNRNEATTQLFYFVNKFHDHLLAAPIGFDAASGNFQGSRQACSRSPTTAPTPPAACPTTTTQDNANLTRGRTASRPDADVPVRADPDRARRPDPVRVGQRLDDPQVVYHEYTHGLSNRLITDAQGYGAARQRQSGAMGEAWSDWYALDFLAARASSATTRRPAT